MPSEPVLDRNHGRDAEAGHRVPDGRPPGHGMADEEQTGDELAGRGRPSGGVTRRPLVTDRSAAGPADPPATNRSAVGNQGATPGRNATARVLHSAFTAEPLAVRAALHEALTTLAGSITTEDSDTLQIVLAEVFNNIVEHSYANTGAGEIRLSIIPQPSGLLCAVTDCGPKLPAPCLRHFAGMAPRPRPADLPEGGFGWFLIRELVEDLTYHRTDGRNLLIFRLPYRRAVPA